MDLLTKMFAFDPKERIDIDGIKTHEWMYGPVLNQTALITEIRNRHRRAERKRRQDVLKMQDFAQSEVNRSIDSMHSDNSEVKLFPEDRVECTLGEVYTFLAPRQKPYDLYYVLEAAIASKGGESKLNTHDDIVEYVCQSVGFSKKMEIFWSERCRKNAWMLVEMF